MAKTDRRTGVTIRSARAPDTLSCTISMLEQKATVTQLTARMEEISCPPTKPFSRDSGMWTPAGMADRKFSR